MGDLLTRRRELILASGGVTPLYRFLNDFTRYYNNNHNSYTTVSNGNHFIVKPYKAEYAWIRFDSATGNRNQAFSDDVTPLFSLHSGDEVTTIAKNITYTSNNNANQLLVMLRGAGDSAVAGLGTTANFTFPTNSTTRGNATQTYTMSSDVDVLYFRINREGSNTYNLVAEFDLEIYVNGVRYL